MRGQRMDANLMTAYSGMMMDPAFQSVDSREAAWHLNVDGSYSIQVSDLHIVPIQTTPCCYHPMPDLKSFQTTKSEGEIVMWQGRCACGTKLTVFNT